MSFSTEQAKLLIQSTMKDRNLSFVRLSEDIKLYTGVVFSPQWLHRIVNDTSKELSFIRIEALAKYFNVPIDRFTKPYDLNKMRSAEKILQDSLQKANVTNINFRNSFFSADQMLEVARIITEVSESREN